MTLLGSAIDRQRPVIAPLIVRTQVAMIVARLMQLPLPFAQNFPVNVQSFRRTGPVELRSDIEPRLFLEA